MRIETATARDVETLVALLPHVHDIHVAAVPWAFQAPAPDAVAAAFAAWIERPTTRAFIAWEDDAALGYLLAFSQERAANPFGGARRWVLVEQIAVDPAARQKGVARALMDAAARWARELGIDRLELETWAFNARAQAAFQALGFRPMRHRFALEVRA